jgi:adenosylcobinamide kinase/adenosylcobinamide-phosphate guanylyltransferase
VTARLTVIGGGVRSGKSRLAERLADRRGQRRVFVATAEGSDDEMRARIAAHRRDRGDRFRTVEEPMDPAGVIAGLADVDVVVLDCITLWLSNLLCAGLPDGAIEDAVASLVDTLAARRFETIVVTNEVGLGIVPAHELSRRFRDLAGRAHQRLAAEADELFFGVMGAMLRLAPAPIVAVSGDGVPIA